MFYNTVIAWSVYYLFLSFKSVVPWKGCDNEWNTHCCFPINDLNKIPTVKKHFLTTDNYQKIYGNGLIYRSFNRSNHIKRVVLFDTRTEVEKNNTSLSLLSDGMSKIFNINLQAVDLKDIYENITGIDAKIIRVLQSFFVIQNNQIQEPFNISALQGLSLRTIKSYHHDPSLLISDIESLIDLKFSNKSANIVLNCDQLINNPTQEFYNRY